VHQLKVTIKAIRPPIWRRVLVPSETTLAQLHRVVQEAFGWEDYHLHEFDIDGVRYGIDDGQGWDEPPIDERRATLGKVTAKGDRFTYVYDFGDDWRHQIEVEDVVPAEPRYHLPPLHRRPTGLPARGRGWRLGFAGFLEAIADPTQGEHEPMIEWIGGAFDPERCDLPAINASFTPIRR